MISSIESSVLELEKNDFQTITFRHKNQLQALNRAVAEKDLEIQSKLTERRTFEWISFILFLTCLGMGFWIYRLRKT